MSKHFTSDSYQQSSRHKLDVIVLFPLGELGLAPQHEVVQSDVRVFVHVDEISVGPNLQADQYDTDVQGAVQLQGVGGRTFRSKQK